MNWNKVEDKLPTVETDVLCWVVPHKNESGYVITAGIFNGDWMSAETQDYCSHTVTHWAELPEKP